eukprot:2466126-Ditylum_brightwellii.AAC.2
MLVGKGDALAFKHKRNEIPTTMVVEDKVLGMQGHLGKLHVGKLQSRLVILPNGGVDALHFFGDAKGSSNFLKELFQRKDLVTGNGQGSIFALHCALTDDSLKFAAPQDWTVIHHDNIAGARLDTMGILIILCLPQAHKVSINIRINLKVGTWKWLQDHAFVMGGQEVLSNVLQIFGVKLSGAMGVPSTLVDSKGNVGVSIVGDIHHHPNGTGIVEISFKGSAIFVLAKSSFGNRDTNKISILKVWAIMMRSMCPIWVSLTLSSWQSILIPKKPAVSFSMLKASSSALILSIMT